jgi:hypothetical protein
MAASKPWVTAARLRSSGAQHRYSRRERAVDDPQAVFGIVYGPAADGAS